MHSLSNNSIEESASLEAVLLSVPDGYHCVDLSLYKVKNYVFFSLPLILTK